jgi:hypothetical protein
MMERVGDRWEKMEESCSTGQSPQWAALPVEEEEEEEEVEEEVGFLTTIYHDARSSECQKDMKNLKTGC